MRASHAFAYDAANNRTSAFSAQAGATAKAMTAAHNNMNQITTLGGGGKTRVAGSLDEPGQVSVGIVGQGDKPARMLSGNRFETELDLPSGTSTLQITAADGSANLATKQYSVVTSPETSRTVTHDADGNMTSDGVRTYEWDTWSRLTKITWATGKTTTFHYNALGERTKMVHVDAGVTRTEYFLYDGPRPIQRRSEGNAASNIDREYFSGGERRWNISSSSWSNHHYCRDHLGSVREVLDSSGTLLARYDYAPYGERETRYEASGYSSDVGFTGHFLLPSPVSGQSEILLAHYRAYDPVLGRWLSQDPIREEGGINLYGYVGGRVAVSWDLFGLEVWEFDSKGFHWHEDRRPTSPSYVLDFENGKPVFRQAGDHPFPGEEWCRNHFEENMKNEDWKEARRKQVAEFFDDPKLKDKPRAQRLGRGLRQFAARGGKIAGVVGLVFLFANRHAEAEEIEALTRRWIVQPEAHGAPLGLHIGQSLGWPSPATMLLMLELSEPDGCP